MRSAVRLVVLCAFIALAFAQDDSGASADDTNQALASATDGGVIDVNQNVISMSHYVNNEANGIGALQLDKAMIAKAMEKQEKMGEELLKGRVAQMQQEEQNKQTQARSMDTLFEEEREKKKLELNKKQNKTEVAMKQEDAKQKTDRNRILADADAQVKKQLVEITQEEAAKINQQIKRQAEWKQQIDKKGVKAAEQEQKAAAADLQRANEEKQKDGVAEQEIKNRVKLYAKVEQERLKDDQERDAKVSAKEAEVKKHALQKEKQYEEKVKAREPGNKAQEEQGVKARISEENNKVNANNEQLAKKLEQDKRNEEGGFKRQEQQRDQALQHERAQRIQNEQNAKSADEQQFKRNMNDARNEAAAKAYNGAPNLPHHKHAVHHHSCFVAATPIIMADGSLKRIADVRIGDMTKGGRVTAFMEFETLDTALFDYDGIVVAGEHKVFENGFFLNVAESKYAQRLLLDRSSAPSRLYDFDTTEHRIFITGVSQNVTFADYSEVALRAEVQQIALAELNSSQ